MKSSSVIKEEAENLRYDLPNGNCLYLERPAISILDVSNNNIYTYITQTTSYSDHLS
jgi:hypothetical protein